MDMRWLDSLTSADPDVRGQAGRTISRVQIARFGVASGDRPGDQVADHIGGSVRLTL
jgi:hypothetical protein